tara:strand:- start:260 stop:382 length:123 start_codon:yes stop_codon:yes gene_type:complete
MEAIQRYRSSMAVLQTLEELGHDSGLLEGPRTSGRKLKTG